MEYITSWERKGIERGRAEGRVEGMQKAALVLLTRQLGQLSDVTSKRIGKLAPEKIEALLGALLDFKSKADLDRWLRAHSKR